MNPYSGYVLNAMPYLNMLKPAEKAGEEKQNQEKEL